MIFGEVVYALFLLVSLVVYWIVPRRAKTAVVAVVGVLFYGYYAGAFLWLLVALTLGSWLLLFATRWKGFSPRLAALAAIFVFVAVLAYFKYFGFLRGVWTGVEFRSIAPPLAISFFIFEFIHIAAEKYKGNVEQVPLAEYFAFIFFFPTMIAGPIKRYDQFDEQLNQARFSSRDVLEGLFRILIGLVKKAVIADNLDTIIQEIGSPAATQNVVLLSVAILLYGFRIFLDFAGYSDIAIGSARLFGIRVPENFLHPYRQTNISAFWRHWHISLYTWLIDYIYIPLGGSRAGFSRALLNIMIVMLVSGLWHGAAWNFVLWGAWHGLLLVTHKVYNDKMKARLPSRFVTGRVALALSYLLTMSAVWFGWLLFMWPLHDVAQYLSLVWERLL